MVVMNTRQLMTLLVVAFIVGDVIGNRAYADADLDDDGLSAPTRPDALRQRQHTTPSSAAVVATMPRGHVQLDAAMIDVVRYEGETVRLRCEITGQPLPRYSWYKDGQPIVVSALHTPPPIPASAPGTELVSRGGPDSNVTTPSATLAANSPASDRHSARTTAWGSRLKIDNLRVDDSGVYRCEGFNAFGRRWVNGSLIVRSGPNANPNRDRKQTPMSATYEVEESDVIDREDLDFGVPRFHGLANQGGRKQQHQPRPHHNPGGRPEFSESDITFDLNQRDDAEPIFQDTGSAKGQCHSYEGLTCSAFVGSRSVYVPSNTNQGRLESRLAAAMSELAAFSSFMSPECMHYALPVLCYSAFPPCSPPASDNGGGGPASVADGGRAMATSGARVRRLCRDACDRMERSVCSEEFAFIQRTATSIDNLISLLPDCSRLSNDRKECIEMDEFPSPNGPSSTNHECYNGTGKDYRGPVGVSRSGRACLRWSSPSVRAAWNLGRINHHQQQQHLPGMHLGDHNFCRNPENVMSEPWCYVGLLDKPVKELCTVRKCSVIEVTSPVADVHGIYVMRYAVLGIASFAVIVVVATLISVCLRRRRPCVPRTATPNDAVPRATTVVVASCGGSSVSGSVRTTDPLAQTRQTQTYVVDGFCGGVRTTAVPPGVRSIPLDRSQQYRR